MRGRVARDVIKEKLVHEAPPAWLVGMKRPRVLRFRVATRAVAQVAGRSSERPARGGSSSALGAAVVSPCDWSWRVLVGSRARLHIAAARIAPGGWPCARPGAAVRDSGTGLEDADDLSGFSLAIGDKCTKRLKKLENQVLLDAMAASVRGVRRGSG